TSGGSTWSNLDAEVFASLNLSTAGNGDAGDQLLVLVTPNDGTANGTQFTSPAVTVQTDTTPPSSSITTAPAATGTRTFNVSYGAISDPAPSSGFSAGSANLQVYSRKGADAYQLAGSTSSPNPAGGTLSITIPNSGDGN